MNCLLNWLPNFQNCLARAAGFIARTELKIDAEADDQPSASAASASCGMVAGLKIPAFQYR